MYDYTYLQRGTEVLDYYKSERLWFLLKGRNQSLFSQNLFSFQDNILVKGNGQDLKPTSMKEKSIWRAQGEKYL